MSHQDKIRCEGFRSGRRCPDPGTHPFEFLIAKEQISTKQPTVYVFELRHTSLLCAWCYQQASLLRGANVQRLK